jgi:hypothetical protein
VSRDAWRNRSYGDACVKPYLHRAAWNDATWIAARSQALLYFVVAACPLLGSQEAGRMTRMGRVSTEV